MMMAHQVLLEICRIHLCKWSGFYDAAFSACTRGNYTQKTEETERERQRKGVENKRNQSQDRDRDRRKRQVMNEIWADYSVPFAQQLNNLRTFSSALTFC